MDNSDDVMAEHPTVVIGVDGSEDSLAAVRWAQRYADATGAAMHLLVAWDWPAVYGAPIVTAAFDPPRDAQHVAEKAAAEVRLPADRVTTTVLQGSPRKLLVEAAQTADLLVVGSHGHSGVGGALLGSVSNYCSHHSVVPVVIVR